MKGEARRTFALALLLAVASVVAGCRPNEPPGPRRPLHPVVLIGIDGAEWTVIRELWERGELPFGKTIAQVVGTTPPATVLHLMADSRPFDGVGETDLVRGACWLGALPGISLG